MGDCGESGFENEQELTFEPDDAPRVPGPMSPKRKRNQVGDRVVPSGSALREPTQEDEIDFLRAQNAKLILELAEATRKLEIIVEITKPTYESQTK